MAWRALFNPLVVLYDNGPLITHPGGGGGGADASRLQDTSLTLNVYGFAHAASGAFRVADEFTIPAGASWQIDTIAFFAYQTGSGTTSSITSVTLRIWDGPPGAGGSNVVFGDTTTNRMASTAWINLHRDLESAPGATNRPVMRQIVTVNTVLAEGTYWLDWNAGGSASFSGPWQPPVTIVGQTNTGNAQQFDGAAWVPMVDTGASGTSNFPQGAPFVVEGTALGGCAPDDIPWLSTDVVSGTTAPASTSPVVATFGNMSALALGVYTGRLCVNSNDPVTPLVTVPVTLTIRNPTSVDTTQVSGETAPQAPWLDLALPLAAALLALAAGMSSPAAVAWQFLVARTPLMGGAAGYGRPAPYRSRDGPACA